MGCFSYARCNRAFTSSVTLLACDLKNAERRNTRAARYMIHLGVRCSIEIGESLRKIDKRICGYVRADGSSDAQWTLRRFLRPLTGLTFADRAPLVSKVISSSSSCGSTVLCSTSGCRAIAPHRTSLLQNKWDSSASLHFNLRCRARIRNAAR